MITGIVVMHLFILSMILECWLFLRSMLPAPSMDGNWELGIKVEKYVAGMLIGLL